MHAWIKILVLEKNIYLNYNEEMYQEIFEGSDWFLMLGVILKKKIKL